MLNSHSCIVLYWLFDMHRVVLFPSKVIPLSFQCWDRKKCRRGSSLNPNPNPKIQILQLMCVTTLNISLTCFGCVHMKPTTAVSVNAVTIQSVTTSTLLSGALLVITVWTVVFAMQNITLDIIQFITVNYYEFLMLCIKQ